MKNINKNILVTVLTVSLSVFGFTGPVSALAFANPAVVNLGGAGDFAVLSKVAITNVPASTITGDIGVSPAPATAITGFTCPAVTGTVHVPSAGGPTLACQTIDPAYLTTTIGEMESAYTDANSRSSDATMDGDLGGETLVPGVYSIGTSLGITSNLTLDCSSEPTGVFIFQIGGNLSLSANTDILPGSCQAGNIFWAVAGTTNIGGGVGTESTFIGTVLAGPATSEITVVTGSTVLGRLLGQKTVALDQNSITVPVSVPPLSSNKNITAFSFPEGAGVITGTDIAVTVPFGTNVTALIPTIVTTGVSVSPLSGVAGNFTLPVMYTVTAADASTKIYTVTVTITPQVFGPVFIDTNTNSILDIGEQDFATLQSAITTAVAGDTIGLSANITTSAQVTVNKALTIDGNGFTLNAVFAKTDNSNNSAISIQSDNVTVKDLVVDGTGSTALHGINIYQSANVNLEAVTVSNNPRAGIAVNGSVVTLNNITTAGNGWGGINVDQGSGVILPATLTVNGVSSHTEAGPDIWKDDNAKVNVSVVDTNTQYSSVTYTHDISVIGTLYTLIIPNPVPVINSLSIVNNQLTAGDPDTTLHIFGTGFSASTSVTFGGSEKAITLVSPTDISIEILASEITTSGARTITVTNLAPGGGTETTSLTVDMKRIGGGSGGSGGTFNGGGSSGGGSVLGAFTSNGNTGGSTGNVTVFNGNVTPPTGQVLGASTDAIQQAQISILKLRIQILIQQVLNLLWAQVRVLQGV